MAGDGARQGKRAAQDHDGASEGVKRHKPVEVINLCSDDPEADVKQAPPRTALSERQVPKNLGKSAQKKALGVSASPPPSPKPAPLPRFKKTSKASEPEDLPADVDMADPADLPELEDPENLAPAVVLEVVDEPKEYVPIKKDHLIPEVPNADLQGVSRSLVEDVYRIILARTQQPLIKAKKNQNVVMTYLANQGPEVLQKAGTEPPIKDAGRPDSTFLKLDTNLDQCGPATYVMETIDKLENHLTTIELMDPVTKKNPYFKSLHKQTKAQVAKNPPGTKAAKNYGGKFAKSKAPVKNRVKGEHIDYPNKSKSGTALNWSFQQALKLQGKTPTRMGLLFKSDIIHKTTSMLVAAASADAPMNLLFSHAIDIGEALTMDLATCMLKGDVGLNAQVGGPIFGTSWDLLVKEAVLRIDIPNPTLEQQREAFKEMKAYETAGQHPIIVVNHPPEPEYGDDYEDVTVAELHARISAHGSRISNTPGQVLRGKRKGEPRLPAKERGKLSLEPGTVLRNKHGNQGKQRLSMSERGKLGHVPGIVTNHKNGRHGEVRMTRQEIGRDKLRKLDKGRQGTKSGTEVTYYFSATDGYGTFEAREALRVAPKDGHNIESHPGNITFSEKGVKGGSLHNARRLLPAFGDYLIVDDKMYEWDADVEKKVRGGTSKGFYVEYKTIKPERLHRYLKP
ncbi:hypothetical protein DFJ74DRAFT_704262 [Hyaloraphidium curvatum]|nr:hypothetical protein DFJ74DRAFT_704262 [Hyaloraphidium curvatum]